MAVSGQKLLKLCQVNCENLFIHLDLWQGSDLASLNEKEWQKLSSASTPNKPLRKVKWLAETLLNLNADILFLNEVGGRESLDNFSRHFLKDLYIPLLIEGNSQRGIDVGFLLRRSLNLRPLLLSHRQRPLRLNYPHESHLPNPKTYYFSRDAQELRLFRPGENSPSMVLLNVHLKSKLDPEGLDPEGRLRREAEVALLVDIYLRLRQELGSTPVVIGGDFNGRARHQEPDDEFKQIYSRTDLIEALSALGFSDEESTTQVQFSRAHGRQLLTLDYFFVSPELAPRLIKEGSGAARYLSDGVTLPLSQNLDQRLVLPSDHYPICLVIAFDQSPTDQR